VGCVPESLSRSAGRPSAWLSLPPQTEGQPLAFDVAVNHAVTARHGLAYQPLVTEESLAE
jgi:hypothetical protein